jgi:hypothetical protein
MTYKELLSRSEASASYWRKEYESMLESRGKYITAAVSAVLLLEVKADWVKHVLALEHANEREKLQYLTATMENLVKDVDGCLKLHGWVRRKGKVDD